MPSVANEIFGAMVIGGAGGYTYQVERAKFDQMLLHPTKDGFHWEGVAAKVAMV